MAAEPASADRDRRSSRRPSTAGPVAGGPAEPAAGISTAGISAAGASAAVPPAARAAGGESTEEAASTQDPATATATATAAGSDAAIAAGAPVEAALSELLQRGRAAVSDAVVSSQSRISDLGQRCGAFGRERWRGLRDLVRDCLDESLSPLRAAAEDGAAAAAPPPAGQTRSSRIKGTATDSGTDSGTGSGTGRLAAAAVATAPPASASSSPGSGIGRASPPPLFGARLDAAAADASTASTASTTTSAGFAASASSRDQVSRRSDAAASRPAPAPAALSDLQAWLPDSRDLPRAS